MQVQQREGSVLPGTPHQPEVCPAFTQASWQSAALPRQRSQPSVAHAQHCEGFALPGCPQVPLAKPAP